MVKDIIIHTVICDNCGKDVCEESEYSGWNDQQYVNDIASESDWHIDEDKHYCPDCFTVDEDDNIVINAERTKLNQP